MEITIKKLEQLAMIHQQGSFSKAADKLHITQPALSRSIAAFELDIGLKLFDRGRSGAKLTPAGTLVVAEAEILLQQSRTFSHNLQLYRHGATGKLKIGMGPLVASLAMPKLSITLLHSKPQLQFQAVVKSANLLLTELRNDELELLYAAKEYFIGVSDLDVRSLSTLAIARIVRAEHPLATHKTVTQSDLANYPVLCATELSSRNPTSGAFICDNYHILSQTVTESDSVWIGSPRLVQKEIDTGRLLVLNVDDEDLVKSTSICEVRRKGITPSPAAELVSQFMRNYFCDTE